MTKTTSPTRRETFSLFQGRNLIIELHPTWITMRQKGKRYRYTLTYDQAWKIGAQNAAIEARIAKLAKKKGNQ